MQRILALLTLLPLLAGCAGMPIVDTASAEGGFDDELLRAAIAALHEQCPLNASYTLLVTRIPGYWGQTWYRQGRYWILIEARQSMGGILDTLNHEWAHAMAWDASEGEEYDSHGPVWGVSFARCYRVTLEAQQNLAEQRRAQREAEAQAEAQEPAEPQAVLEPPAPAPPMLIPVLQPVRIPRWDLCPAER